MELNIYTHTLNIAVFLLCTAKFHLSLSNLNYFQFCELRKGSLSSTFYN